MTDFEDNKHEIMHKYLKNLINKDLTVFMHKYKYVDALYVEIIKGNVLMECLNEIKSFLKSNFNNHDVH